MYNIAAVHSTKNGTIKLGNMLGDNAVNIIFDFLEDSSVAATCGTDIIVNESELEQFEHRPFPEATLYFGSMESPLYRRQHGYA